MQALALRCSHPFKAHDNLLLSVAFSPDGSKIISGSEGNSIIRVWDAGTGAVLPRAQIAVGETPGPVIDELGRGGWLTNINTYRTFKPRLGVEHLRLQPYFCEIERMLKNF
jgi:WD40 repeat protein